LPQGLLAGIHFQTAARIEKWFRRPARFNPPRSRTAGGPLAGAERPAHDTPENLDSPAAFLDSPAANPSMIIRGADLGVDCKFRIRETQEWKVHAVARWGCLLKPNKQRGRALNNHVARKLKLGPVQGMGDRWGGGMKFYSMNRDFYVKKPPTSFKKSKTKISNDVLKKFLFGNLNTRLTDQLLLPLASPCGGHLSNRIDVTPLNGLPIARAPRLGVDRDG
jgi:hypothetical protein